MKRIIAPSILLLTAALIIPLLFVSTVPSADVTPAEPTYAVSPIESAAADAALQFTALVDGIKSDYNAADYLPHVIAGEMPAIFEYEALKAQAVAARTYLMYCMGTQNPDHPSADVCGNPDCCKNYASHEKLTVMWGEKYADYWDKICRAVTDTDGQYLTYEGIAIQAVFHSSSPGKTEASGNIWAPLPYLVSVESPENEAEVPNFISTVEISPDDFKTTIHGMYPEADLSGDPSGWLGSFHSYASGRIAYGEIGGVAIPGTVLRSLFGLRSTCFSEEYNGSFLFTVKGYGHGVGMSQYGANIMAKQGADYTEILAHYYSGTTLSASA